LEFTYGAYGRLIGKLRACDYTLCSYHDWKAADKCVILRHDVDYDMDKAVEMAERENDLGVRSTYFVLLTSDLYNVFSMENGRKLRRITDLGHEIGLHFDEVRYPELRGDMQQTASRIIEESALLSSAAGCKVTTVSMHRPSREVLDADLKIPGMINSYGSEYFKGFKYLSDSRRRWREPVEEIVEAGTFPKLHILTHAFWYNDEELTIEQSISGYINGGNGARYKIMESNITDLESIMSRSEVK